MFNMNMTDEQKLQLEASFKKLGNQANSPEYNAAAAVIAQAIQVPIREVVLSGDIIKQIYTPMDFRNNPHVILPTDLITPGQEREFYAYTIPDHGRIPERRVESDYIMIPTFRIGNAIDATLKYVRDANWAVITRMMEVFEAGVVKKMNDDGWQTIIAAATDRNVIVNDPNAVQGQFTPRLITLLSTYMRRNGGGNASSTNRIKLTDLYISLEAHMDIRAWGLDVIPDGVRQNIYYSQDGAGDLLNIFGVKLHAMDEFGVGQEYQNYFTQTLGGSLSSANDLEIGIALDQSRSDVFAMPVREDFQVWNDPNLHRQNLIGFYGHGEYGYSVTDNRRTLLCSL